MSYDSRPETYDHIMRVRHFIYEATANLQRRAAVHDQSKMHDPELAAFDEATPKLAQLEYGSDEYKEALKALGPALQHHFRENSHHPEHWEGGVNDMSLLDLIEMLCDWRAASERTKQRTDDPGKMKSFASGLEFNFERFGIEPQLAEILRNTVLELEM